MHPWQYKTTWYDAVLMRKTKKTLSSRPTEHCNDEVFIKLIQDRFVYTQEVTSVHDGPLRRGVSICIENKRSAWNANWSTVVYIY